MSILIQRDLLDTLEPLFAYVYDYVLETYNKLGYRYYKEILYYERPAFLSSKVRKFFTRKRRPHIP